MELFFYTKNSVFNEDLLDTVKVVKRFVVVVVGTCFYRYRSFVQSRLGFIGSRNKKLSMFAQTYGMAILTVTSVDDVIMVIMTS